MLPVPAPSSNNAEQTAEFSGCGTGWKSNPMPVLVSGFFMGEEVLFPHERGCLDKITWQTNPAV